MLETLPPGNRMAIFALGDRLHMLHDFSSNPAPLLAAVDRYDGEQPFWWVGSRDSSTSLLAAQFPSSEAAPWGQRPVADTAAAAFAQEQRVLTTFDAMTTIAKIMGHASGRKYLLWVSSAFPLRWYPPEAVQAIRAMNKAGLALYAIDPRGILESFAGEANVDTMKELAEQTGGRTFCGNNDVGSLLRLAVAVLSNEGFAKISSVADRICEPIEILFRRALPPEAPGFDAHLLTRSLCRRWAVRLGRGAGVTTRCGMVRS